MNTLRNLLLLSLVLMLTTATAGLAADTTNTSLGLTAAGGPLAIHGFDAISYFDGMPRRGLAQHSSLWNGAVYRFASKDNLKRFEKNPSKYAPQFGGFCAYGVSVGKKFDGDPEVYKIVNGKLYFNLNPQIKQTWEKDVPGNLLKAEKQWTKIANKSATSL